MTIPKLVAVSSPPAPDVEDWLPPHVQWLIDNYTPPRSLTWSGSKQEDSALDAAAKVYLLRKRRETFIEWLWRSFPPD